MNHPALFPHWLSTMPRRGLMFVLSSPSGAGKTSLSRALMQQDPELVLSISATTRAMRPGEEHGRDYFFHSEKEFLDQVSEGQFLEYAKVFRPPLRHARRLCGIPADWRQGRDFRY